MSGGIESEKLVIICLGGSRGMGMESPPPTYNQAQGYPPPQGYPPQQGYPPPEQGYPPPQQGYPPPHQGYPAQPGYAPVPQGYPPTQQGPGYPQHGQPTTVVVTQPMTGEVVMGGPQPPDYMLASIGACICCCPLTGIIAIYYAYQRNNMMAERNVPEASRMATNARKFIIASVIIGIIVAILSAVLRFLVFTQTRDSYYDYYN